MIRGSLGVLLFVAGSGLLSAADQYSGPRPEQTDVPFLLHANKLLRVETLEAQQQDGKDATTYTVMGATSPTRTPVPEPIFIFRSGKINPEKLSLYRMDVKGGNRLLVMPNRPGKNSPKPVFLMVSRLDNGLFKVEVNEVLENGEYCMSPDGSNQVFCFTTY